MPANKSIPLSVAIVTKDEQRNIGDCIRSVAFANEIIVVDSGSTDDTVKIATELGARVYHEQWKGYGAQKNSAVEKCANEWVLILDADERVPAKTAEAIACAIEGNPSCDAFNLKRKNYFNGRWIKFSGWPDWQRRLVRKGRGAYASIVHEEWHVRGRVDNLDAHLDHYSYESYDAMLGKAEEYSALSAQELKKSGKRPSAIRPALHWMSTFLKVYVLNGGFLYGRDGLMIARVKARGSYLKHSKLNDLYGKSA